jgi:two-component system sensor histidine kinase UhpB
MLANVAGLVKTLAKSRVVESEVGGASVRRESKIRVTKTKFLPRWRTASDGADWLYRAPRRLAQRRTKPVPESPMPAVDELFALLDGLPASVALWDNDVRLRYGNRRALTRFGRPHNALLGAHLSDLVQADAVELSAQYIDGALAGQPQQVERAMVDSDGQRYNAHQVTHVPNVVAGAVHGYCALAVDITASIEGYEQARRVREQAALRDERKRIAGDIETRHVVDDLSDALERLDGALNFASDALPSLSTAADAIDRVIEDLRATVPTRMPGKPQIDGPLVAFPSVPARASVGSSDVPAGPGGGVPWPPHITGRGWSAEELCALLDLLPAEVAVWDASLRNVFANRAAVRSFGRADRGDVLGQHARDLLGAKMFEAANVAYAEAALLGEPQQFDRTVAHSSGVRHLQVYCAPRLRGGEVDGIYSFVVDVTPRVEAELALQEARAELVIARERERIAAHLRTMLERLFAAGRSATLPAREVAQAQVRCVQDGILAAFVDLESAMTALHENVGLLDLLPDLAHLVHGATKPHDIAAAIENVGSVEYIPPAVGAELLAVAQQALSNVAIHSGASDVVVTIAADASGVWLRVVDDGRGIGAAPPGNGMANMAERARRLGGTCTWRPYQPSGTVVDWRVPTPSCQ